MTILWWVNCMYHRCRNMLKVEGAIVIIARKARGRMLTTPTFRSNHAHFCINEAVRTDRQDFLAVERAVSQLEVRG